MNKRPYADSELFAYSAEHVYYEVWMFFEMMAANTPPPTANPAVWRAGTTTSTATGTTVPPLGVPTSIAPPPGPSSPSRSAIAAQNALVESFMIHLRNLIEFLFED